MDILLLCDGRLFRRAIGFGPVGLMLPFAHFVWVGFGWVLVGGVLYTS